MKLCLLSVSGPLEGRVFLFEEGSSNEFNSDLSTFSIDLGEEGDLFTLSLIWKDKRLWKAPSKASGDASTLQTEGQEFYLGQEILWASHVFRLIEFNEGVLDSHGRIVLSDSCLDEDEEIIISDQPSEEYPVEELYSLGLKLNRASTKEELVKEVKDSFKKFFIQERVLVFLWDKLKGTFYEVFSKEEKKTKEPFSLSRTLVERVLKSRKPVFCRNVWLDSHLKGSDSLHGQFIRSVLSIPLIFRGKVLGLIYVDSSKPSSWSAQLIGYLGALSGNIVPVLNHLEEKENLEQENRLLKSKIEEDRFFLCPSKKMSKMYSLLKRVAPSDLPVLLQGETGTGKEWCARLLHEHSKRMGHSFIALNCAALSKDLLESELFGHEKGSFTGAHQSKKGMVELAQGGTLFLDEIGEMPLEIQSSFLRFLQEKEYRRLGGTRLHGADIRVLAATNRDLKEDIDAGLFRKDLFYRLTGLILKIPPLRERPEDIEGLIHFFLKKKESDFGEKSIPTSVMESLKNYSWPGNVRELKNSLERALFLAPSSTLSLEDFFPEGRDSSDKDQASGPLGSYREALEVFEKEYFYNLLVDSKGNVSAAAKKAQLDRTHLYNKINRYGFETHLFRKP